MKLRDYGHSRALVVCIEGSDGVGKHTQSCHLANRILEMGKKARVVSVPVPECAYHKAIYTMLEDGKAKTTPELFQALQTANRLDFQARILPGYLADLDCLVLDRWVASTYAYGGAIGSEKWWMDMLSEPLIEPDVTIVIDGPCHREVARDVYEKDTSFQDEVQRQYRSWVVANPVTATTVNGGRGQQAVALDIWEIVRGFLT